MSAECACNNGASFLEAHQQNLLDAAGVTHVACQA